MLRLVLGIAGTGKTTEMLAMLKSRAQAGRPGMLLVPEQFSSSTEGMAYHALGDALSGQVEILSFRTLAQRILRQSGAGGLPVLDDAARVVYVRRALNGVGEQLRAFSRQRRSAAFCSLCAQTLSELKTAGATPARLHQIAQLQQDDKLGEIALIFDAYEAEIANTALDPEDRLSLASKHAGDGWLSGKACYVDSFDGFTAPEYEMLEQLMAWCDEVTVSLCCNSLEGGDALNLFAPVRRVANKLQGMAQKLGVQAQPPLYLGQPKRQQQPVLVALNQWQATGTPPQTRQARGLWLSQAADEWEEVRQAAAQMHRLALEGVPYSRMALVCRDPAFYEAAVRRQMKLYDIPFFYDAPTTIEYTAPVAFIRAALALVRGGLTGDNLLALAKTGLCGFGEEAMAALENYVFTWQPKAAEWRAPFEKNPNGLMAPEDEEGKKQLALAEGLRAKLVPPVERFVQKCKKATAQVLSKQLYLLLAHYNAPHHAERLASVFEDGETGYGQRARRAWNLAMQMLDSMASMLGGETLAAEEYDELFLLLVRATDFGQTPQSLECAVFTGADRMRLAEPDYCFVLGVCEGEFPMQVGYSGLLTHNDRDRLVEGGIELPGSFENRTLLEQMFFYKALCSARKGLYLSWPKRRGGEAKAQSTALQAIARQLEPPPLVLDDAQQAAAPAAAFEMLGEAYRMDAPRTAALYAALEKLQDAGMDRALQLLREIDNPGRFSVEDKPSLHRLVGSRVTIGATAAEQFYRCRFSYYLERVLRVRPRRRAELSPAESGTFVHYILEQVLGQAGANFKHCTDGQLGEMATGCADRFIAENGLEANRRTTQQLGRIKEVCIQLLVFLRDAAGQSEFAIEALELPIGDGEGDIPPLEVTVPGGHSVRVVGVVDRLDTLHRDGKTYLCIIDYKTGDKELKLDEIYCGRNLQMMVYMDALCQNGGGRFENPVPAGVLYLGGDPAPQSGDRNAPSPPPFKLSGLLLDEEGVLRALDDRSAGGWLPLTYLKGGAVRKTKTLAGGEKFSNIMGHVRGLLGGMAQGIEAGSFDARPLVKGQSSPCDYCPYRAACRHEDGVNEDEVAAPPDVFEPEQQEAAGTQQEVAP